MLDCLYAPLIKYQSLDLLRTHAAHPHTLESAAGWSGSLSVGPGRSWREHSVHRHQLRHQINHFFV